MRPLFWIVLICLCAVFSTARAQEIAPSYYRDYCRPQIEQVVAGYGLSPGDVDYIDVKEKIVGAFNRRRLIGWTGWVRPRGGGGYLVVEVGLACGLQQVYTTGGFQLPGVSSY